MANISNASDFNSSVTELFEYEPLVSPSVFRITVSVILSLIILIAVVGNTFVISAFCLKRRLRKPSNYFILNLAITDLSLAILILPISAVYDVLGIWLFGPEICLIWTVVDVFVSTASILNLVAISADRYMAISNCMLYPRMITGKRVAFIVATIYFISLTISIPPVLGWGKQDYNGGSCFLPYSTGYVIYSAIGSFYLPFLIMTILYCKIYKVAKSHMKSIKKRSVVGSLLYIDGREGELERVDSRSMLFADDKSMNRRLTSSSSGYSSSKPGQRFSQVSRSTADTLSCHPMSGSRYSLYKQDSSDTLMVPGRQRTRSGYMFISPLSSRSSRSSGSVSVSDFDGASLPVPRDSMRSSRSSSSSYGGDMESDLLRDYFKRNHVTPRASYVSQTSSTASKFKRSPISRRFRRFMSERKAVKTVSMIVGAFMICWTPFSIVYLLNGVCKDACKVSDTVFKVCFWLGYVNSVLNPIIYSMHNKAMKSALLEILSSLCCGYCGRHPKHFRGSSTRSTASMGSFMSVGESDWQYGENMSVQEEVPVVKKSDKHLSRQVRQSMPTASCPVQVYINEPRKSRAGSIVSWSMAALKGTLHDKLTELDRQSNEDMASVHSDKSVLLPAVSFTVGGDEADTESQASTLERCHNQQHAVKRSTRRGSVCVSAEDSCDSGHSHSPKGQRRRSSSIFLTPSGDGGWSNKYTPLERECVRRSSKVPSLEDIQETLSQDTRRSSDETSTNITRQNSLDQFKNPSFDATSSANSTLQDSKKSSTVAINTLGGLVVENTCSAMSMNSSLQETALSKYDTGYDLDRQWTAGAQKMSIDQNVTTTHAVAEVTPRSVDITAPPSDGILVTVVQDNVESHQRTLHVCINSTPSQQIQNIRIVLSASDCNTDISKQLSSKTVASNNSLAAINDDQRMHKSRSDSCLLQGNAIRQKLKQLSTGYSSGETAENSDRECLSAPERRKRYNDTYGDMTDSPENSLQVEESDFIDSWTLPAQEAAQSQVTSAVIDCSTSTSTLSSLGLDNLFDSSQYIDYVPDFSTAALWDTPVTHQAGHIWRSKSEPSLTRSAVGGFNTITPKYAQYLQGFINRKPKLSRRDSVISSVNTDYTYEEGLSSVIGTEYDGSSRRGSITSRTLDLQDEDTAASAYGTEYEGDNSQRSSLTSNNDEPCGNQMECETSSEDIMVPAIHVTKTDDITTVIQASSKFPSYKSPQRHASLGNNNMINQSGDESAAVIDERKETASSAYNQTNNHRQHPTISPQSVADETIAEEIDTEEVAAEAMAADETVEADIPALKNIEESVSITFDEQTTPELSQPAVDWMAMNMPAIQLMVNRYVQEIVKTLAATGSTKVVPNAVEPNTPVVPHEGPLINDSTEAIAQDDIELNTNDNNEDLGEWI